MISTDAQAAFDLSVECRERAVKAEAERDALREKLAEEQRNWALQFGERQRAEAERDAAIKDRDEWRDLYITALDEARGYQGISNDDTLCDALQTLVDMRLRAEARADAAIEALRKIAGGFLPPNFDLEPTTFHEWVWVWSQETARAVLNGAKP